MGTGLVLAYLCPVLLKADTIRCKLGLALRALWSMATSTSLSLLQIFTLNSYSFSTTHSQRNFECTVRIQEGHISHASYVITKI